MKITTLTAEEFESREGGAAGRTIGAVLAVAGLAVWIFLRAASPFIIWIALGLLIAGVLVILFSSSITLNASKRTGQLRYQKKRIIGSQDLSYSLGDVFRVETRKQWRMQEAPGAGDQGPARQEPVLVAQSVIIFKDGKELALNHEKTSSSMSMGGVSVMSGQSGQSAMAAQLAQFLGVPFQEIGPQNSGIGLNISF